MPRKRRNNIITHASQSDTRSLLSGVTRMTGLTHCSNISMATIVPSNISMILGTKRLSAKMTESARKLCNIPVKLEKIKKKSQQIKYKIKSTSKNTPEYSELVNRFQFLKRKYRKLQDEYKRIVTLKDSELVQVVETSISEPKKTEWKKRGSQQYGISRGTLAPEKKLSSRPNVKKALDRQSKTPGKLRKPTPFPASGRR